MFSARSYHSSSGWIKAIGGEDVVVKDVDGSSVELDESELNTSVCVFLCFFLCVEGRGGTVMTINN